jgi:hypothetical protein
MRTYFLWLLVILVLLQAFISIETSPEFHVLSYNEYLKQIQEYNKLENLPPGIGRLETNEYFNGKNGRYLVNYTLVIDAIMFFLLIAAIRSNCKEKPD